LPLSPALVGRAQYCPMTTARAHLVDPDSDGFYHCASRCVRRGWLCGQDPVSGRSYEHRKDWLESRILMLSEVFCLQLCSYAVMSNHFHVVVEIKPTMAKTLSDEEVAERWLRLCSQKRQANRTREIEGMLANAERLAELRKRLGSLSWFMKSLNEPIARAANREDGCKGRFWEGRFGSFVLLDETAVVGCMAYVDLNPVRAGIVDEPKRAPFTSIRRRLTHGGEDGDIAPLVSLEAVGLNLSGYLDLLNWTAERHRGRLGEPRGRARQVLRRFGAEPTGWLDSVKSHRRKFRAYGSVDRLERCAQSIGQKWVKGVRFLA